jgi:hypothetical protein
LIKRTATSDNIEEIAEKFLKELAELSEAQDEIIDAIIYMLSYNCYELIEDFKWLIQTIFQVIKCKSEAHESQLADIL